MNSLHWNLALPLRNKLWVIFLFVNLLAITHYVALMGRTIFSSVSHDPILLVNLLLKYNTWSFCALIVYSYSLKI
ncbi:MAG: hypothetical protein RLO81_16590, partial [Fulvivirga sp.]|uniref:hypothetical protein n=1 Tax=Fulvivirga sp. TaxID=1931237 RepID=UPI0032F00ED8